MTTPAWARLPRTLLEREVALARETAVSQAEAAVASARADFLADALADPAVARIVESASLALPAIEVLAVVAAVDLDLGLQRLAAVVSDDPRQQHVDLAMLDRLLGPEALDTLGEDDALLVSGELEHAGATSFATTRVALPLRVARALRGELAVSSDVPPGTDVASPGLDVPGIERLALVHGDDRVRRQQAAMSALAARDFLLAPTPATHTGWQTLVREATVLGAGVVLELVDGLDAVGRDWLERADHLVWGLCSAAPLELASAPRRPWVEVAAADPVVGDAEWAAVFPGSAPPTRRPTATQLFTVAQTGPDRRDPQEALRRVASGTLLKHATRIVPRIGWDDLVLPRSQERQLRAVIDRYHQRSRVHDDWGLSLYPSPGVVALFSGPSGTGKTTSAEVIAHELGMDMFRVDLSALVSKYIGETEKNLEEIFSAAHTGNYVLLFDEADSLFGSRSKVEDAKDRYANMEVSYLLQRLETYDGVVVLTSNFQGNIDQAFLRRIHVTVHFTVPSAAERERIWDRALGHAPRRDLDLAYVAEKFDLSGGSIRNAALTAAFSAAARDPQDGPAGIGMVDVLRAVVTEQTKLGRRPQDAQLGPWLAAVRDHDNH